MPNWPFGGMGLSTQTENPALSGMRVGAGLAGILQAEKDADAKAKKAEADEANRKATLEQGAALGAWNQINDQMKISGLPKSVQHQLYNSARPIASKLGFPLPEIGADEWQPSYAKLFDQATKVLGMPGTYAERQQRLNGMLADIASSDPAAALVLKRQEDQLAARRTADVSSLTDLTYRALSGDDAAMTELASARAIALSPDTPETKPWEREAKQERAVMLYEASQTALKRLNDEKVTVGKDTRMFQRDPQTGQVREVVPAEPKEPKEPGTLVERIEQLQSSGKPEDAARADRLLALSDLTRQSMTINLPKTPPTEFISAAQTTRLAAQRLARTVERFDPSFVGMLGKLKGLSTRFSDLPGVPAFAERKAFANDLIAMTNDVKKQLLGAARTVPELADLARFLPDPDQNLSVAEFKGNFETFIEGFVDVIDVLPGTLEEMGLRKPDFTKERKALSGALEKLRSGDRGAPAPGAGLEKLSDDELMKRLRQGKPPRG